VKIRKYAALLMVLTLVAAACSKRVETQKGPRTGQYGDPNAVKDSPTPSPKAAASVGQTGSTAPKSTSTAKPTQKATTAAGPTGVTKGPRLIDDFGAYGVPQIGRPVLQPDSGYDTINLEIDFVEGREPTPAAVNHLVALVKRESGKSVTLNGGNSFPPLGTPACNHDSIRRVTDRNRSIKSEPPVASFWVGYLNGICRLPGGGRVLGAAYFGTVVAIYKDVIEGTGPQPVSDQVEKVTLVHEFFHLIGMINIGYKSPRPHAHPDHPTHSKNPHSVMYWAFGNEESFIAFITNGGSPPTDFDADDRADLKDIREGRL